MTRIPMIAGNWKMNKTMEETKVFIDDLKKIEMPHGRDILICPPFTSLFGVSGILKEMGIRLGAQNMHYEEKGAFTGEISPLMLNELGVEYVILGHSERRHIFEEGDEIINKKVKSALSHGIIPILCVGETMQEREDGNTRQVIKSQLFNSLEGIQDIEKVIIAYEPVWAIGTGVTATPHQAEEVHAFIRSLLEGRFDKDMSLKQRILYGGSVNPGNIKQLMQEEDVDGVLVGGASLDLEKFGKILNF